MKNYSNYYNYDQYRDNYNDNYDRQTNYYNNASYDRYEQNDNQYGYYDEYYQQKKQTPIYDDYQQPKQQIYEDYYQPKYDEYYQRRYYAPPLQFTKVFESVYEPIFESRGPQTIKSVYFDEGMISDMEFLNFPLDGGYKKYEFTGKRTHQKGQQIQSQVDQNNPVSIFLTSLLDQLPLERQIEDMKKKLVQFQDFNIPTIFDAIDTNGSQKLLFQEFYNGLENFVQNSTQETMYLVFTRFQHANQTMTLQQFIKIFMPFTNIQTQAANPNIRQLPNDKSSKVMGDLLNLYMDVENRFEQVRRQMQNIGIDYTQIFNAMDINGMKRIGINQFKQAFNNYAYSNIQHNDAQLLFSRFDKSGDGTVSYMEFKTELEPKLE